MKNVLIAIVVSLFAISCNDVTEELNVNNLEDQGYCEGSNKDAAYEMDASNKDVGYELDASSKEPGY